MSESPSAVSVREPAAGLPDAVTGHKPQRLGRLLARLKRVARFVYDLLTHSP
jgi:hypothetical protein